MVLRQHAFVLWVLPMLGVGCTKEVQEEPRESVHADAGAMPPPSKADAAAGFAIPEDWQTYENHAWRVALAYPKGWHLRERTVEETGAADELWVDFNAERIVPLPEADPVYPLTLIVTTARTVESILDDYRLNPELAEEAVTIAGKAVRKLRYPADLLDGAPVAVYLIEQEGIIYDLSGLEELPELSTVVESLVARGGQ